MGCDRGTAMRKILGVCGALLSILGEAHAADYKTLRQMTAPPPITVQPLPAGAKPQSVQFTRVVIRPAEGEDWAAAYDIAFFNGKPENHYMLTWRSGEVEADSGPFGRVFAEELKKAGFAVDS